MPLPLLFIAMLAFLGALTMAPHPDGGFGPAMALADDDDDDGGSSGGGGGGGGRSFDNDDDDDGGPVVRRRAPAATPVRRRAPAATVRRAPVIVPAPAPRPASIGQLAGEIVVRGLSPADRAALEAQGFRVISERSLRSGQSLMRLMKPAEMTDQAARDAVRAQQSGAVSDFNHLYAPASTDCAGSDCLLREMIGWPVAQAVTGCGVPVALGMIDTGVDPAHPALTDAQVRVHRLDTGAPPSGQAHGTAVAALLVGAADGQTPGLVPHMPLVAVDAFHASASAERADAFALIEALDWLAGQQVRIINMSLAGPPNEALREKIAQIEAQGILIVAAAGNAGPAAKPLFPAGYDPVLAVTAVDRQQEVYRRAVRGAHIDLAAPGVGVRSAGDGGAADTHSGTSFAAPFATAAAALILQQEPGLRPAQLRDRLRADARDLGDAGPDAVFGHGLLAPGLTCAAPASDPQPAAG